MLSCAELSRRCAEAFAKEPHKDWEEDRSGKRVEWKKGEKKRADREQTPEARSDSDSCKEAARERKRSREKIGMYD